MTSKAARTTARPVAEGALPGSAPRSPDARWRPAGHRSGCFVAVADVLHFGAAATYLGIRQSSLWRSLVALETAEGAALFQRSTRRVTLSEAGIRLPPQARTAVAAAHRFVASAASGDPAERRLGVMATLAPHMVPAVLAALRTHCPHVQLHAIEDRREYLTHLLPGWPARRGDRRPARQEPDTSRSCCTAKTSS